MPCRWSMSCLVLLGFVGFSQAGDLTLYPREFNLRGKGARQRLLVMGSVNSRFQDLTRQARFSTPTPTVIQVSPEGLVTPVGNGAGVVTASVPGQEAKSTIRVSSADDYLPVTLERDVTPVLTRYACNAGACHGKARGQNGFQLSLLGFDPDFDYHAMTQEARGRRVFPAAPDSSLLLRKPSAQIPHGGGKRLEMGSQAFEVFRRWVVAGTPRRQVKDPVVVRIELEPAERLLIPQEEQQLLVTAHYSDGTAEDVTHLATYQSNEAVIAAVNAEGRIKAGPLAGEAALMARYMEKFAVCNVTIPQPGTVPPEIYAKLPRTHFIDRLVWDKLQRLGITPSQPAGDATFLRRSYLDVIGRLPTPEETRAFLAEASPGKRDRVIDSLLDRPEYADHWASKWADLLRPNPYRVGMKAVYNLDAWLRDAFRRNKPLDLFAKEILTAQGSTFRNGATVVLRDRREPDEITTMVTQIFLGIRLDCARCHHHPFEIYGQDDFYGLAAYFSRIGRKVTPYLSTPISGGEEVLFLASSGQVKHPINGKVMEPRPLFGTAPVGPTQDPRRAFADWATSDSNPFFARVQVNRVWADLMGRGLVEPVDDLRNTNPASNGPLLEALADEFRRQRYDQKKLLRTIMTSTVYGLSSRPTDRNLADTRNYSRHYRQRLRAEVLLDAISDVTGTSETFSAMPTRARANQLWTVRAQSTFLDSFGRPDPNQDPPCERNTDTTVVQALHLMNSENLHRKVTSDEGRAQKLAASKLTSREIVDELYLLVYARFPDEDERRVAQGLFERTGADRRRAVEDLLWALINTPEFVFKD